MIELLFVVCALGQPDDCRERSLIFTDVTPMQCLMGAQPELAKWSNAHPNDVITSWRCQMVNLAQQDT